MKWKSQVLSADFWILRFGFWVLDFEFYAFGFKIWVVSFSLGASGYGFMYYFLGQILLKWCVMP